jgi:hypothetical protein
MGLSYWHLAGFGASIIHCTRQFACDLLLKSHLLFQVAPQFVQHDFAPSFASLSHSVSNEEDCELEVDVVDSLSALPKASTIKTTRAKRERMLLGFIFSPMIEGNIRWENHNTLCSDIVVV